MSQSKSSAVVLADIVEEIKQIEDYDERGELLIEFSERFQEVPNSVATRPYPETHKVPGCESEAYVWLSSSEDGGLALHFAVENPQGISAKAMAVILQEGLNGQSPDQIQSIPSDLAHHIFGPSLSMGKAQGLSNMVGVIKHLGRSL